MPLLDDGIIRTTRFHPGDKCDVCGNHTPGSIVIAPQTISLPEGVKVESTILKGIYNVGITCGCYAKFHRQVAHIEDKMKGRK